MEKKLTPVGTILEWIDEKMEQVAIVANDGKLSTSYRDLEAFRKVAAAQLPEEQAMAEDCHNKGIEEGRRRIAGMHPHYPSTPHVSPTEYFESTYRQK